MSLREYKGAAGKVRLPKVVMKHHFKWFSQGKTRALRWKWRERAEEERESTVADLEIVLQNRDWWGARKGREGWDRKADAETMVTNGRGVQTSTHTHMHGIERKLIKLWGSLKDASHPRKVCFWRGYCTSCRVNAERMSMQPDCTRGNAHLQSNY